MCAFVSDVGTIAIIWFIDKLKILVDALHSDGRL